MKLEEADRISMSESACPQASQRVVKTSPANPREDQATILTNLYSKSRFHTMDCPHLGRLWLLSQE